MDDTIQHNVHNVSSEAYGEGLHNCKAGRVVGGPLIARKCCKETKEVKTDTGKLGMSSGYRKPARRRVTVFHRRDLLITGSNETLERSKKT